MNETIRVFSEAVQGSRLDAALSEILPAASLRARRRFLEKNRVFLNDRPARAAQRVRTGDRLRILAPPPLQPPELPQQLGSVEDYEFFFKPAGWHTVALAGSESPNLEEWIKTTLGYEANLLQRLDQGTSGIVCAAKTEQAKTKFRKAEHFGTCQKYYLALMNARVAGPAIAKCRLDVNNRSKTRIMAGDAPPELWTRFIPLGDPVGTPQNMDAAIALCVLTRGQRHQVRAHAASLGAPLIGDPLYGFDSGRGFFLEHCALTFNELHFASLARSRILKIWPEIAPAFMETLASEGFAV